MHISSARSSSLNCYEDCEFRFFLNYVCGVESLAGKRAALGTTVHLALQKMADMKKAGRHLKDSKFNDPEFLLAIAWNRITQEVPDSYTQEDYEFCQDQIKNVLQTPFHPFLLPVLETEKQFELRIAREGFDDLLLRGTIDLVTQASEDTIEFVDFKTGVREDWLTGELKELEDFQKDLQLNIYNLAIRTLHPDIEHVLGTIFYTRSGGPFTVALTKEDAERTLEEIRILYNNILANNNPKRLIDNKRRKREFFKCKYVCQFGVYGELLYSDGQKTIVVEGKISKPKEIPQAIERDGRTFYFVEVKQSLCRKYHNLMKKHTPELAVPIIQALTVKGKPVSARNDYAAAGIYRGVIE